MRNSVRRGLFHPDDIKIIGLSSSTSVAPGPLSAPLPQLTRKTSRPSISPIGTLGHSSSNSHARSGSITSTPLGSSGSGSFGRSEAKKAQNQAELGKYTEDDDDDDYEDVFGKPNASCEFTFLRSWLLYPRDIDVV